MNDYRCDHAAKAEFMDKNIKKLLSRQTIDKYSPVFEGNLNGWTAFYNHYIVHYKYFKFI